MHLAQGARQTILHEIIGRADVPGQRSSIPPEARDFGFDPPINVGHPLRSFAFAVGLPPLFQRERLGDSECNAGM
jgi:hypothetical protein